LNQPLGAIENFASGCERLLKKDITRVDDVLKALAQIRSEASRGAQVIKSIREFVKRDNEQQELVSVQGVFSGLTPLLEIQAKSSHSKLNLECRKDIHLTTNRALFEQVLLNLARNGFEAMADQPTNARELSIRASASQEVASNTAQITVEDNGSGIDDAFEKKLFTPFASTKPNGMGIGLSLCLSIVERQGGSIRWERREQGGTKFTLVLPKTEVEA
jgi:C4-dicarboxylate-specific signal transduction histidine kinase